MQNKGKYQKIEPSIPKTAVDIYRMLPEGTRCEVIFNELIMSPSPSSDHQFLLTELVGLLFVFLKNNPVAKAVASPLDVYLEDHDSAIQPDLMIILNDNLDKVHKDGFYGTPDIVLEILSTNKAYDTQRKKALYEKAGVKEYFMVDPSTKTTTLLTLNAAGVYEQTYEAAGTLRSSVIGCDISF